MKNFLIKKIFSHLPVGSKYLKLSCSFFYIMIILIGIQITKGAISTKPSLLRHLSKVFYKRFKWIPTGKGRELALEIYKKSELVLLKDSPLNEELTALRTTKEQELQTKAATSKRSISLAGEEAMPKGLYFWGTISSVFSNDWTRVFNRGLDWGEPFFFFLRDDKTLHVVNFRGRVHIIDNLGAEIGINPSNFNYLWSRDLTIEGWHGPVESAMVVDSRKKGEEQIVPRYAVSPTGLYLLQKFWFPLGLIDDAMLPRHLIAYKIEEQIRSTLDE